MKHLLLTTIAAVLVVGCGKSQQSSIPVEAELVEPVAEVPSQQSVPAPEAKPVEPVAETAKPEPTTAKAPEISIHEAAREGNIEAVKQRLADSIKVNKKDEQGRTALLFAVYENHKEIVELLIEKGADLEAKFQSTTPLHYVGNKEIAELLIVNGAYVNSKDALGLTPLDTANISNLNQIADLLRKHGGKTGEELKAEGK